MRILHVVTLISPDGAYGGPARVALNSCAELIRRGHDVTIAAATRGQTSYPALTEAVPSELFASRMLLPTRTFHGMGAPGLTRWFAAHATDYDVVHIHLGRDLVVLPIAMSARRRKIPYVLQTHGMVTPAHALSVPIDACWTRRALRDAGAVCYLTERERQQLVAVGGAQLRLHELGNGVPEYPGRPRHLGRPEVLFAARLHRRKRPLAFVQMARLLLDSGVDARFTLVGPDGGEGSAVSAAIDGNRAICWEGPVAPDRLPARLSAADIYVLPATMEPYPMSVLEAMSVGLPVVINEDCGLAPAVDRAGCGIVTDGAPASIAAAVGKLLGDPALAMDMGHRGRRAARTEFAMPKIVDRLAQIYDHARAGSS